MDWLSIVIAVLVFVVPALLERDKKKKQRERWKKTDLPDREDAQESLETRDVQREFAPVDGRDLTEDPYRMENVEPAVPSVPDASSGSYVTDSHSVYSETGTGGGSAVRPVTAAVQEGSARPAVPVSAVTGPAVTRSDGPASAVSEVRRKRRLNARDMVIYSEIMRPKYLENREMK